MMAYKVILISFLWLITEILFARGSDNLLSLNNVSNVTNNHSEEAMKRLLRVFGLDSVVTHAKSSALPPQYMLDLYKSYSDNSISENRFRHRSANTVRSFLDKGEVDDHGHYYFELRGSIPKHEEIVDAEFHFFTNRNAFQSTRNSHVIQIHLYEGQKNTTKLLQARIVSAHSSGWEVFRVKSSAKKWFSNPELNTGLTVKVLDSLGYEWSNDRFNRLQNFRRPILVIFSKDLKIIQVATPRYTQDSDSLQFMSAKKNKTKHNSKLENTRNTRSASMQKNELCARHELRVDFDKLGWSTWIISPKWYDAYVCTGACAFPLGQHQQPTNHATVQSIVHELGLTEGIGTPCCVPTKLHPVNLLYFDERSNVVLKQYDDMIAAGCGCQ